MKNITIIFLSIVILFTACQSERDKAFNEIKKKEAILAADSLQLNDSLAYVLTKDYEAFSKKFPADKYAPEFLFKAADIANGMENYGKSIELFNLIADQYPDFNKAAESLFLCAFIYEQAGNVVLAEKYYKEVIARYPKSELKAQSEASIKNLGKSPEELVKEFEAKVQ